MSVKSGLCVVKCVHHDNTKYEWKNTLEAVEGSTREVPSWVERSESCLEIESMFFSSLSGLVGLGGCESGWEGGWECGWEEGCSEERDWE